MQQTFWITNGVHQESPYLVIVKVNEVVKCAHCYRRDRRGFKSVGNVNRYEICVNCLYHPSVNALYHFFTTISKKAHPEEFNNYLKKCVNIEEYQKLLKETGDT